MKFTPDFLDEIRARVPVSEVVGRHVKLQRRGREFVGLSPFNPEKTPSFTVNDQKGFYHCFSSGKHGDIFGFLIEVEGLSFPEAVEQLAQRAGLPMPERRPGEEERQKKRASLYEVMEKAAVFFEEQLAAPGGQGALRYLRGRGLDSAIRRRFRLGYAPGGRYDLKQFLAVDGMDQEQMVAAGLLIAGEDIAVSYDRFRHRVMFPITDLKGRVIAFGGRALSAEVPAKYLNSPETELFHKGAVLYNLASARQAAHERQSLVVAEGYMDVIALHGAGIPEAVAPLGTALTEQQLQMLWRLVPEPVLCFDGDKAGLKAAWRALDMALPQLEPGVSLRFALLPEGLDPDDLIRDQGPEAMRAVLDGAMPLVDMLWRREVQAGVWDTPERRAGLEKRLDRLMSAIGEPRVRRHYEQALRQKLQALWQGDRHKRQGPARHFSQAGPAGNRPRGSHTGRRALASSQPVSGSGAGAAALQRSLVGRQGVADIPLREALLLLVPVLHPVMLEKHAEDLAALDLASSELDRLRSALLDAAGRLEPLDRETLRSHLAVHGFVRTLARLEVIGHRVGRAIWHSDADPGRIEAAWLQNASLHRKAVTLEKELKKAEQALGRECSEANLAQLNEIRLALQNMEGLEAGYGDQDI